MTDEEAPKYIYLHNHDDAFNRAISYTPINDTSIKYIRHDRYIALLDAAVSLHHWLFEVVDKIVPIMGEYVTAPKEHDDIAESAQLALDKWDRFLDGKEE